MKTSILIKALGAVIASVFSFYAPIYATVLIVMLVISARFFLDLLIVKRSNRSSLYKCKMYTDAGENFFKFAIVYLAIILLMYPTDIHLLAFFGSKNFIVTRIAALFIIVYEWVIINLRVKSLTGKSIGSRAMEVVNVLKQVKEIKKDLQE